MIKCNVTLCGKIFISAQEKTSKDGQKFLCYGRRLPWLQFKPSLALSSPLNLPAPGRRQPIYVIFRFSIDLCFW